MRWKRKQSLTAADAVPDVPVIYLDDEPEFAVEAPARHGRTRAFALSSALVAAAAAAVVFVAAIAPGSSTAGPRAHKNRVVEALSATTDTGSFNVQYRIESTPGATPNTSPPCAIAHGPGPDGTEIHVAPTCTATIMPLRCPDGAPCPYSPPVIAPPEKIACALASGVVPSGAVIHCPMIPAQTRPACGIGEDCIDQPAADTPGPTITGSGSIQLNPLEIQSVCQIDGVGRITIRANDTDVWESVDGRPTRYTLSDFLKLGIQSVGVREGSVAMISLASPTGYLDLTEQEVTGAAPIGTDTVDGVKVSLYEVTLTPAQMADVPGTSPEEAKTISDALKNLAAEGSTGTTMRIGIGDDGLIHSVTSTSNFEDGGKVTLTASFSNFGASSSAPTTTVKASTSTTTADAPTTTTDAPTTTSTIEAVTTTT